jgi:hypothetical protein
MHINYYEYDKNNEEHRDFLDSLKNICGKYNIPIPEVERYGVEDSVVAEYKMSNGMNLFWGCPWCEDSNDEEIKLFSSSNEEEWLDHLNPCRKEDDEYEKENEYLKSLSKEELLIKIDEQSVKQKFARQECDNNRDEKSNVGLAMKLLLECMKLSKLKNTYNSKGE